jgi:hypothetical protein
VWLREVLPNLPWRTEENCEKLRYSQCPGQYSYLVQGAVQLFARRTEAEPRIILVRTIALSSSCRTGYVENTTQTSNSTVSTVRLSY